MPRKRSVSIADEYEYRLHQRGGTAADQLPAAAMGGDRDALARCAGIAAAVINRQPTEPHLTAVMEWVVYALGQIQAGAEPNAAFGWKRGKGRPRDFRALQRDFLIGSDVEALAARDGITPEQAADIVGPRYARSVEHALTCYKALRDARNNIAISAP